jgi:ribonuclease HII
MKSSRLEPDWRLEHSLWNLGYALTGGIDEAGRGALAGPVAAAVVLLPCRDYPFNDSKQLTPARRELLAEQVKAEALAWALGWASAAEVDALNVLRATHLAARRALAQLHLRPAALVTDYLRLAFSGPVLAVPKADARSIQVAAASILAKTARDARMRTLAERYPPYGFEHHKGYGSAAHLRALEQHGPSPEHRRSFRPVGAVGGRLYFPTPHHPQSTT